MRHLEFDELLRAGAERICRGFQDWETPGFYLQFGHGFDLDGLFDGTPQQLALSCLPGLPEEATPDGHEPQLLYGRIGGLPVLALHGHRHLFEGLGVEPCILPLSVAWKLGTTRCIFADPALSLLPELKTGSWGVLTDFINGHRLSPLDGLLPLLTTPFPDMTHALSQRMNSELVNALARISITPRLCVYQSLPGAHFCTPAEAKAARTAHADLVGHDLVMEIIMAHALGCDVSALALASEAAPLEGARPLRRATMLETCRYCSSDLMRGLRLAIADITESMGSSHVASLPEATAEDALFKDFRRPGGGEPVLRKYLRRGGGQS